MSIQKEIVVRYRDEGHVRFQIPSKLCGVTVAKQITTEILKIEGIYQVNYFRRQGKLSIRYKEVVCEFKQLAIQLFQLISQLEEQGLLVETEKKKSLVISIPPEWEVKSKLAKWKPTRWASEKYTDIKETTQAVKILAKGWRKKSALIKDPEKATIDFFNDILVLYLIKLHWTRITQEWMLQPWTFKTQWTAIFYLFYLFMRSRRPSPKPS